MITPQEAADLLWVTAREISYYATKGYITKHYVLGNDKHYLVSESEVRAQPEQIGERIKARNPTLRNYALSQPKDDRGWFMSRN